MTQSHLIVLFAALSCLVGVLDASAGDANPIYKACVRQCERTGCVGDKCFQHCKFSPDGKLFDVSWYLQEPLYLQWKQWDCHSNCQYHCMLAREEEREKLGDRPVKYHGKWPFRRVYGIQEPVSVALSALNLAMQFHGWLSFFILVYYKLPLQPNKRTYYKYTGLWHIYGILSMNSWFWSAVFHCRKLKLATTGAYHPYKTNINHVCLQNAFHNHQRYQLSLAHISNINQCFGSPLLGVGKSAVSKSRGIPLAVFHQSLKLRSLSLLLQQDVHLTEKLDYSSAVALLGFSLILAILRAFNVRDEVARIMVATPLMAFVTTHILYLNFYQLDYGLNMKVCVAMGGAQLFLWAIWAAVTRHPSRRKLWVVVVGGGLTMLLEIYDFPPYRGFVDAHALRQAATIPFTYLWWSFIRDDGVFRTSAIIKKAK